MVREEEPKAKVVSNEKDTQTSLAIEFHLDKNSIVLYDESTQTCPGPELEPPMKSDIEEEEFLSTAGSIPIHTCLQIEVMKSM